MLSLPIFCCFETLIHRNRHYKDVRASVSNATMGTGVFLLAISIFGGGHMGVGVSPSLCVLVTFSITSLASLFHLVFLLKAKS